MLLLVSYASCNICHFVMSNTKMENQPPLPSTVLNSLSRKNCAALFLDAMSHPELLDGDVLLLRLDLVRI